MIDESDRAELVRLRAQVKELEAKLAESEMANTKAVEALMLAARRIADLLAALEQIAKDPEEAGWPNPTDLRDIALAAIAAHQGAGT